MQAGFKKDKVKNICKVFSGATPSTNNAHLWNGDILWITPNDLSKLKTQYFSNTERKITTEGLNSCSTHLLPKGTLVMSSRAPIGYLAISENNFTTNQGCKSIVFYENYDSLFFYYNFLSHVNKLKALGEGTTFAEISKNYLEEFELSFPESKIEQIKIAAILSTVDEAISQTEKLIAKFQRIKTGLMHDLLSKGIDAKGNIRHKATHKFVLKKGIEVPNDWDVKELSELCDIKGRIGWQGYTVHDLTDDAGEPLVIGGTQISKEHRLNFSKPVYLKRQKYLEAPEIFVKTGNIVLVKTGNTIGKTALVDSEIGDATINPNTVLLRNFKGITNKYLYLIMISDYFQKALWDFVFVGAQPSVNQTNMKTIKIALPSEKEQILIVNTFFSLTNQIDEERKYLSKLNSLKTGLMQDLLSGKVRVKA